MGILYKAKPTGQCVNKIKVNLAKIGWTQPQTKRQIVGLEQSQKTPNKLMNDKKEEWCDTIRSIISTSHHTSAAAAIATDTVVVATSLSP